MLIISKKINPINLRFRKFYGVKNHFNRLVSLIFAGLVFLMNNKVLAQGGPGAGGAPGGGGRPGTVKLVNPLGTENIVQIINNVLNYLIYISVPILAIMILIGGFQILTARDNPEKIKGGKTTIMYAVIGFTIILISKGVALILLKIMR